MNVDNKIVAYCCGFLNGFEQPYSLPMGLTHRNYNVGQWLGRIWCEIKRGPVMEDV